MKPLAWTQKPPTVPGWYWFENRHGEKGCVEVDAKLITQAERQYGYYVAGETDFALWWAGPIPEPINAADAKKEDN